MNRRIVIILLVIMSLTILTACGSKVGSAEPSRAATELPPPAVVQATIPPIALPVPTEGSNSQPVDESLARSDAQGAVEVVITPLNLTQPGETLDFDVSMNTHSVDLSMDLTKLATLTTDAGVTLTAAKWDAPMGGHHVSGTLSFPASQNGQPILTNATTLTLILVNVDSPERVFTWQLPIP